MADKPAELFKQNGTIVRWLLNLAAGVILASWPFIIGWAAGLTVLGWSNKGRIDTIEELRKSEAIHEARDIDRIESKLDELLRAFNDHNEKYNHVPLRGGGDE